MTYNLKWVWDGFKSSAIWLTCDNKPDHVQTIDVTSAIETVDTPDCTHGGYIYRVATIDVAGKIYTTVNVETIDQLGHALGEPTPVVPTPDQPEPTKEISGILGYVNGDGQVNSAEALLILRNSVSLETFDDTQNFLGNVNSMVRSIPQTHFPFCVSALA